MYGYIYITTNLINGMKYIGKHKAAVFDSTYKGSGKILLKAFKKYGRENFKCQILEQQTDVTTICESLAELNAAEKFYIDYYNCVYDSTYYNLKPGGDGGCLKQSEQTKEKLSHWNTGRTFVNNGEVCIKVPKAEIAEYLAQGWAPGPLEFNRTSTFKQKVSETLTGYRCMHKDGVRTRVSAAEVEKFLKEGYQLGWPKTTTGLKRRQSIKYMMKDGFDYEGKDTITERFTTFFEPELGDGVIKIGTGELYYDASLYIPSVSSMVTSKKLTIYFIDFKLNSDCKNFEITLK